MSNTKEVILDSELNCPECGFKETLSMPTDACLWFHECANCKTLLKPLEGDCCVFCSYGTVPCPPIQQQQLGGSDSDQGGCCGTE